MIALAYNQTSRAIGALADCTAAYVLQLAREGLIEHVVASDGTRLFAKEVAGEVRRIKEKRLAGRGLAMQRARHARQVAG